MGTFFPANATSVRIIRISSAALVAINIFLRSILSAACPAIAENGKYGSINSPIAIKLRAAPVELE